MESQKRVEVVRPDPTPIAPIDLDEFFKRPRRSNDFDRGYEEFLRNYHRDNGLQKLSRYEVKESNESDSGEDDSGGGGSDEDEEESDGNGGGDEEEGGEEADDNDEEQSENNEEEADQDDDEGESDEKSDENRKRYRSKPTNAKSKSINKKKGKLCKNEKRKNMLCNVCYNSKNDEKTESCSYNSEPKGKSYAYSEDKSKGYNNDKGSREELEDDEEAENVKKRKPAVHQYAVNEPRPRYYPRNPHAEFGPQTFEPQTYRPRGAQPYRYQIRGLPNGAVVRYRTTEVPLQRVRINSVPYQRPPQYAPQKYSYRPQQYQRYYALRDIRPPRDINGAHSESSVLNVTKEHQFKYLPNAASHGNYRGPEQAPQTSKDWSSCKKVISENQVCFECFVEGERRRECVFANPDTFFKSFSTLTKYSSNHPYAYDVPLPTVSKHSKHSSHKSKSHSVRHKKKKNDVHGRTKPHAIVKPENYQLLPITPGATIPYNHKQEQQQQQQHQNGVFHSEIIYGNANLAPEKPKLYFNQPIFNTSNRNITTADKFIFANKSLNAKYDPKANSTDSKSSADTHVSVIASFNATSNESN